MHFSRHHITYYRLLSVSERKQSRQVKEEGNCHRKKKTEDDINFSSRVDVGQAWQQKQQKQNSCMYVSPVLPTCKKAPGVHGGFCLIILFKIESKSRSNCDLFLESANLANRLCSLFSKILEASIGSFNISLLEVEVARLQDFTFKYFGVVSIMFFKSFRSTNVLAKIVATAMLHIHPNCRLIASISNRSVLHTCMYMYIL